MENCSDTAPTIRERGVHCSRPLLLLLLLLTHLNCPQILNFVPQKQTLEPQFRQDRGRQFQPLGDSKVRPFVATPRTMTHSYSQNSMIGHTCFAMSPAVSIIDRLLTNEQRRGLPRSPIPTPLGKGDTDQLQEICPDMTVVAMRDLRAPRQH